VLPVLEHQLGPGIAPALARTADLLRDDADALDAWADREAERLLDEADGQVRVDAVGVSGLPRAVRTRLLRRAAVRVGAPAGDLTAGHVRALDAFVMGSSEGMTLDLPGSRRASRVGGLLLLSRS
jgi:tRNA(Ile)-lysidine synthase